MITHFLFVAIITARQHYRQNMFERMSSQKIEKETESAPKTKQDSFSHLASRHYLMTVISDEQNLKYSSF